MDNKSFRTIEFGKVLERLSEQASFSAGQDLARNLMPSASLEEAQLWQAQTAEARELFAEHSSVTIGGARDVRRAVDNAQRGRILAAEEFSAIRDTIVAARNLRRRLLKLEEEFPQLAEIAHLIEECPGIVSAVNNTIDDRGEVLDTASPELADIRKEQKVAYSRIQDKLQRILSSSLNRFLQEPIITMRSGRYVIPLRADARGRIKGIVHDHSGSGATLWLEPTATVELNNAYRELYLREQDEIERILRALTDQIAEQGDAIKRVVERMAELDLIFARARYADLVDAVQPVLAPWRKTPPPRPPKHANERAKWQPPPASLHPGSTVWIKGARHPLLDPETVVPTDLTLDEETFIVLITGPNTGGKTVSLKTAGLMVLMAQSGMHLPAIDARLTVFDGVFADIGDEQSIEQSLSTFSAHMTNITRILATASERSLVLLDELGAGTDPAEGAALAQSIVGYLRDKGATTFVATHFPELKVYASQTSGVTNASLLFDVETLSPTYEMSIGIPGRSNALAIARRLGVDETVLEEAMRLLGAGSEHAQGMLDTIYELRDKIESEEARTRLTRRETEAARDQVADRLAAIEEERLEILAAAREQAEQEIESLRRELRRVRRQLRDAGSRTAVKKLGKEVEAIEQQGVVGEEPERGRPAGTWLPKPDLAVGDIVVVKSLDTKGTVLSLDRDEAMVAIGRLQMRAQLTDLEFKERPEEEEETPPATAVTAGPSPGMELDLRGRRVEDGVARVEKYLDSAFLARLPWVRIIHGKGTGRLREAVREALSANPHVASWEEGRDGEGDAGVTVARLVENE